MLIPMPVSRRASGSNPHISKHSCLYIRDKAEVFLIDVSCLFGDSINGNMLVGARN